MSEEGESQEVESLPNPLPEALRQLVAGVAGVAVAAEVRSGPLPPASELAEYEAILPGAADRVFTRGCGSRL